VEEELTTGNYSGPSKRMLGTPATFSWRRRWLDVATLAGDVRYGPAIVSTNSKKILTVLHFKSIILLKSHRSRASFNQILAKF
jgi:hypothetical protein